MLRAEIQPEYIAVAGSFGAIAPVVVTYQERKGPRMCGSTADKLYFEAFCGCLIGRRASGPASLDGCASGVHGGQTVPKERMYCLLVRI